MSQAVMTEEEQGQAIIKITRHPWYWIQEMVYTNDEHDGENPIKKFPDKEHLKIICDYWHREPLILIPKSRQLMMTWLFVACYLWDTQFARGRLNFFQSKKEEDADRLVKRAYFIWQHQPDWIKNTFPAAYRFCHLEFPQGSSEIWGVPQGGDQLRSHTASGIFSDEMAFQPEAESAYTGAKPTIDGGGRFTGVSSAHPGFFQYLVEDK
ncbi:MAG: hypothetical protein ISS47_06620 [Candidatus Omnitrophica bacterium]|nr:hypothetical protein [Candidatus Omnitrophota bacterium]